MVNSKVSVDIMVKWVKMVKQMGLKIILHYDGKLVEELQRNKVKRIKYDRLSVIARLPEIDGPDSEQILGIPDIKNGKGATQTKAIFEQLDHYGIRDHVIGFSQDTTSANVGNIRGQTVCAGKESDTIHLGLRLSILPLQSLGGRPQLQGIPCSKSTGTNLIPSETRLTMAT